MNISRTNDLLIIRAMGADDNKITIMVQILYHTGLLKICKYLRAHHLPYVIFSF